MWAGDRGNGRRPVFAAFFRHGQLMATQYPSYHRRDVTAEMGIKGQTGIHHEVAEACDPAPLIVVLYTRDKRFTVLPMLPVLSCP
jgi:hypothetical protein